ncbi:hypothetical protein CH49_3576 [Yersinia enterocolitica]|nr:hypothetical protein CH49_3576 [Yersinia enterocolitica]CNG79681.1 Uncharacterised protein [Yersinia enterocolitica]CRY16042.1 Uncharacterised protein [Yersinia enterocolitica]
MNCYDYIGFNRTEIEQLLQINLRDSDEEYQNILKDKLPKWLTPFLSRINITIKETAALIVGVIPYSIQTGDIEMVIINYENSLWDAVDCNLLSCWDISYTNTNKDIRHDGYLLRAEVEGWLKAHSFHWPLPPGAAPVPEQRQAEENWGAFAGKETALAFIAGMAIALTRNNPQCRRGVKMNKTAIARVATQAMLNAGFSGEMVTEKQMSNLISEALLTSLPEADNP